jgi:6-pyruvoyltetrahydropterin/6-carboxytetrahydropterin synthase
VPVVEVTRAYQFSAAHRLHNPRFDPVENARLYGRCNNPSGHGHTYRLEVTIRGPVSPDTGRVEDAYHLDALVYDRIVSRFDRANLDDLITPPDGPTSTTEVVAGLLWRLLESAVPAGRLHRLRLEETPNNFLELERDGAGQSSPARPSFPPGHSCQKVSAP